jgi:hypothetical protein
MNLMKWDPFRELEEVSKNVSVITNNPAAPARPGGCAH